MKLDDAKSLEEHWVIMWSWEENLLVMHPNRAFARMLYHKGIPGHDPQKIKRGYDGSILVAK